MKLFGTSTPEEVREMLNPKPVGDTVKIHVHEAVIEPALDFDELNRLIRDPDFLKTFK